MFFRQYQLACLSLFSYLIGDETTGRAVVVDPQRDIAQYLEDAEANGLTIERVIETHFHADFLSGHLELAEATGAVVSFGDEAKAEFEIDPLAHGQHLSLGEVDLEIRHTPGHTPESISIVVREQPDAEAWAVLTGDTLFVGDVGRPDLLGLDRLDGRRPRPPPLPLGARSAPHAARCHARVPGPWRRIGVRQVDVRRRQLDHRGAAGHELRPAAHVRGRLRRGRDPGPVGGTALLRLRRRRQPSRS